MALDIVAQDLIIDESTGVQDDDLLNPGSNSNATLQYLLSLDPPGGLPPEVAFQANFVQATANAGETITGIVLAQNAAGTAFSTTIGVNSGIQTVDGDYVWLFQDATHPNVVRGVIGTSDPAAAPAADGSLAFSLGLDGASSTGKDLYTVQYVALHHPDATNHDDRIDLTDKVFASVTGTTTASFSGSAAASGNHDFYLINAANDASKQLLVTAFVGTTNATANVSDKGFGVNNQSIDSQPTNETIQVDFVTGGNLAAGSGSQIQYGSHLENVTQAGFTISQITPSTPTLRMDVKISAFNVQGNEQGSNFYDGSPTTAVDIVGIKLTGASGFASLITADGTYATASGNVVVSGLSGTGGVVTITGLDNITTVDVTTGSPMDRLTITGVDSREGMDVSEVHFLGTTNNAHNEEVGSFVNFDDDGPSIAGNATPVPTLTVTEADLATNASASFADLFTSAFGSDSFKDTDNNNAEDADAISYKLGISGTATGLKDALTDEVVTLSVNAAGTVVTGSSTTGGTVFTITVDPDTGLVTLDQVRTMVHDDPSDPTPFPADLINLTAKIIDGDADTASATRDIGLAFNFLDPGLSIDKVVSSVTHGTADGKVDDAGDVINYTITVENTGNVTLTGVTVTDPYADATPTYVSGDTDGDGKLGVDETWSYTAAHTVLQSEIDSNGGGDGFLENIATADSNETDKDTDDASVALIFNPGVSIDKTASIADGHADQVGDIINYTVKVTNTGNVTLDNVQVTDSFEGAASVVLTNANSAGNTFNDPNGNGSLDVGETWTYTYKHVVTQNELTTNGIDNDGSLDNTATVTTTDPNLGPLQDDASIPILLGPGVRTPGFWTNNSWKTFWDGVVGNEPKQAGTNGFADGEITIKVDSNGDGITDTNKGLLIGDFDRDGITDTNETTFFISTDDAFKLLNASQKQTQNAEYQEGRALVATWLNYLAGNPIEAGDPSKADAKDAIQWAVDWMLKTTKQTDGNITIKDIDANAVAQSSAAWGVGIDGPDGNATPTTYGAMPQYNASLDIPAGVQILGVLDEYNNHGTVYGTAIASA